MKELLNEPKPKPTPETRKVKVDPFGFLPRYASAISGLGGGEISPDPKYVFHTSYRPFTAGPVMFVVIFEGLEAKFGELIIHVNGFVPESDENAHLANSVRIDLAELALNRGRCSIEVNCVANVQYAICGYVFDGNDATAQGLRIRVVERLKAQGGDATQGGVTMSMPGNIESVPRLMGDAPPLLRTPVSQPCTQAQIEEAEFADLTRRLGLEALSPLDAWSLAFLCEALDCYGCFGKGASGALVAPRGGAQLATLLAQRGCNVELLSYDDLAALPDRSPFDFLAVMDWPALRASSAEVSDIVHEQVSALKAGGLCVHVFKYVLAAPTGEASGSKEPLPLDRLGIERIALTLLSRGLDLAQLSFGGGLDRDRPLGLPEPYGADAVLSTGRFGLVLRKRLGSA